MLIDTNTFELFKQTINKNGWIELPSTGNSMFPLIRQGNICRFSACDPSAIKKGDIILYWSSTGRLIAHRFYKTASQSGKIFYIFKGDTNLGFDELIEEKQLLGKLIIINRKNKKVSPDRLIPFLWGKLIIFFPLLSAILRKYLNRSFHLEF